MMKAKYIFATSAIILAGITSSCDSYLDTIPDQRAEINSVTKVKDLLISAYPTTYPWIIYEMGTDNIGYNGDSYSAPTYYIATSSYMWKDNGETGFDTPQKVWDACYIAIASANQALQAIKEMGNPSDATPYKGEALMCRAYGHFILANTFCQPYSKDEASALMGIPYILSPETEVGVKYDRGTLAQVYEQLNKDIEEALPLISDDAYTVPLYHFNRRAAYAFAAQFNLYYGNYDKAVAYATEAIGENPSASLRNLNGYSQYTKPDEWTVAYLKNTEACNIMLLSNASIWGRTYNRSYRYAHNRTVATQETFWSRGPWKSSTNNALPVYASAFGSDRCVYLPKCNEMFEVTNQSAQTGQPHVTAYAFTVDETLITRAEAETMLGKYDEAAIDLSYWYLSKGSSVSCTAPTIMNYYASANQKTISKPLHPKFAITEGKQTNMLKAVLHARRIETVHEGKRWLDIRRYGIEVKHPISVTDTLTLEPGDKRYAIQIPADVIASGLTANPR